MSHTAMDGSLQSVVTSLPPGVVEDLLSIGVCPRCILRFLGVREAVYSATSLNHSFLYVLENSKAVDVKECDVTGMAIAHSEEHVREHSSVQTSQTYLYQGCTSNPCVVCLGILHTLGDFDKTDYSVGSMEDRGNRISTASCIVEAIQTEGHLFDTFSLEVTIPGAVFVRETALWLYLRQKYASPIWFEGGFVNSNVVSLKEALKWSTTDLLERILGAKFDTGSSFRIVLLYRHTEASTEPNFLGSTASGGNKRKWHGSNRNGNNPGLNRVDSIRSLCDSNGSLAAIQRALASMSSESFQQQYPCPPVKLHALCEIVAGCYRSSIYIGGRYLKFSRNISQSHWLIDEERKGDGSVQEIIADVVFPQFKADTYKFHAAGREDIDVRMLGNGRPFILEILNARNLPSQEELSKIESSINSLKEGWVKVRGLRQVGSNAWDIMIQGEAEKQKQYTAVVWVSRPLSKADFDFLSNLKELEIQQKTPIRVLHRRSPLVRSRTIHWARCEEIAGSEQYFLLHLCTQVYWSYLAGTYIKEFVHGDIGRTYPSIGSLLGCQAEIIQLDVTDIKMDFLN
eukprot:c21938_g1_i1 orf=56-1765(+)